MADKLSFCSPAAFEQLKLAAQNVQINWEMEFNDKGCHLLKCDQNSRNTHHNGKLKIPYPQINLESYPDLFGNLTERHKIAVHILVYLPILY